MPENDTPPFGTQFMADAKSADAIVPPLPDTICSFSGQDIDQIFHAKALARPVDAGQCFLGSDRDILNGYRFQAGITIAARQTTGWFTEIVE